MDTFKIAFVGVIMPGLISLGIFAAVWYKSSRREDTKSRTWAGVLALAGAFSLAYALLFGIPAYPPDDATKWIPWIVVIVGCFGLIEAFSRLPYALVWFLRSVISIGFTWQLLNQMIRHNWTSEESMQWVGWLSVMIVIIWGFCDETAWRVRGAGLPIALTFAAGALCIGIHWGTDLLLFHSSLIFLATVAGAVFPGLWRDSFSLAAGAMPVYIMVFYSLLMCSVFYANMPMNGAIALAFAPIGACSAMAVGLDKKGNLQAVVAVVGALIPAGIGVYLVYAAKVAASIPIVQQ